MIEGKKRILVTISNIKSLQKISIDSLEEWLPVMLDVSTLLFLFFEVTMWSSCCISSVNFKIHFNHCSLQFLVRFWVQAKQHQSCFRCMLLLLFLLSLPFYVDFAHALGALLLVHHLGLLPGRRGSRSGLSSPHFNNCLVFYSRICLEKLDDISSKLVQEALFAYSDGPY